MAGRRHAGIRIVVEGHVEHPAPFTAEELLPYRAAAEPPSQTQALQRRKTMRKARSRKARSRKARSRKKRPLLLADLERRYRESTSC